MKRPKHFLIILLFLSFLQGFTQSVEYPFANEIHAFKTSDSINPPPQNAILFVGSSSFTKWTDVQNYFPKYTILNRGFGGSCLTDLIRYADDVIIPYHPKQVVIYCGENDFAASDTITSDMVNSRFVQLFDLIRNKMPGVKITYVSIKPSPSRWQLKDKFIASNKFIRQFLKKQPNAGYVDVWNKMLDKKGQPLPGIFLDDQLHMKPAGYAIWQKAIKPQLIK
ncbi:MAG: GDSL-type esterase/lipase family protein [Lentimicrobiaceae bacterium]|jgi:lysophospholipase L1-like esterase